MGKFPVGHPYRLIVRHPALFAANLAVSPEDLPPFPLARLHGAWTRGVQAVAGGEDEVADFLLSRLDGRAAALVVRRNSVAGILQDGDEEATSASAVVTDLSGEQVADLAGGAGITARARRDWPQLSAVAGRYIVSLVVRREALPEPLAHEAFLMPPVSHRPDPRRPPIHLQYTVLPYDQRLVGFSKGAESGFADFNL